MRRTEQEGHGPVRYGPPLPDQGLPVLPGLTAALTASAEGIGGTGGPDGTGGAGGPVPGGRPSDGVPGRPHSDVGALLDAACAYWARRGLPTEPDRTAAASGGPALLLALTAAVGGDVLLPRPCAAWWEPQARLLGRAVFHAATPAECGGVPDPYALLETVRRVRAEGGDPRLLVLSVADDPAATVAPPELLHETVEAAAGEGLHVVSDETWRDTLHQEHDTVLLSPAEMLPDRVTVLTDLSGAHLPPGWPAAVARFPGDAAGARLRARVLDVLTATGAGVAAPVAAAAAYALGEPGDVVARRAAAARLHGRVAAALHRTVVSAGAVARPPRAGRHLYADLGPLRPALAARDVHDAQELEDYLTARLGTPVPGGHRFCDDLDALRVRLSTGPFLGAADSERTASLMSPAPLELPHVRRALTQVAAVFDELRDDAGRWESPR
ncbi:aminotransferase class I/II-fold pyridoxal phosphate-dependent enzyme [Streptomyces minutiscleroticus]|uniref:aminotransferase class I/II-fold pyridoxal phosphate-dependent enzyme n=1 Tax=Streptomyces minutiscleroticus TaxID=68238 RepID=UPI0033331163